MALTTPSMSPAVIVREFDLTGVAPNVETSLAGYVGRFKWGPVDEPKRIGNETQLAETFGIPDETHAADYFSCNQFLRYSGNLIVNRAIPDPAGTAPYKALNAHSSSDSAPLVKNETHFEGQTLSSPFIAKYPGEMGNSLAVKWFGVGNSDSAGSASHLNSFLNWKYQENFDNVPGTSLWAETRPSTTKHDEIHVAVVDSDGLISGTVGTVLETYGFISVAPGAKTADGGDNYFKTVINDGSRYIWFTGWDSDTPHGTAWDTAPVSGTNVDYANGFVYNDSAQETSAALSGGQDHSLLTVGDYTTGFDAYRDVEEIDVQLLIAPDGYRLSGSETEETAHRTMISELVSIAGKERKDCLVVASPHRGAVVGKDAQTAVDNTIKLVRNNGFPASSYLTMDNNFLRVYDKYNDVYIHVPAASTTAGIMALTDDEYGPWWSPAGERRGEYIGITNLAYSPSKAQRDELYKNSVNPIVQFPGRGTILFGDKTRLTRPSAFDRINVRRLFLALEKSVAEAARNFLFEFNDEFTRSEFVAIVEPLLREVQARRGITDYFVQCDERNNSPEVIDRNEMVASIFIKPARSINFITINFVATRTGADFEEIIQTTNF